MGLSAGEGLSSSQCSLVYISLIPKPEEEEEEKGPPFDMHLITTDLSMLN